MPFVKGNRAKKSTGRVYDAPSPIEPPNSDNIEEILDSIPRPTFKSNTEPFIMVCQDEKLSKAQLDYLSKQWEIYELFIKELEMLNKKIIAEAANANKPNSYISYDSASLSSKRIRKPKAIYSPPHEMSSTFNYSSDENISIPEITETITPIKRKRGFLPRIKLLTSTFTGAKRGRKPLIKSNENDITEYYYGKKIEENTTYHPNNINNKLTNILKCSKCFMPFSDNITAMSHVMNHLKPMFDKMCNEEHRCKYCYRRFSSVEDREIHQVKVHMNDFDSQNICLFCELHFPNSHELQQHMTQNKSSDGQHTVNQFNSSLCSHKPKEMPFWCQLCETQSSSFIDILFHFKNEHQGTLFALCPFCLVIIKVPKIANENELSLEVYFNHMIRHVTPTPENTDLENVLVFNEGRDKLRQIQCSHCRLNFCHIEQYEKHRAKHHEAYGGNAMAKSSIRNVTLPRKLGDFWSIYGPPEVVKEEPASPIKNLPGLSKPQDSLISPEDNLVLETYATSKVIRKPKIDLKSFLTDTKLNEESKATSKEDKKVVTQIAPPPFVMSELNAPDQTATTNELNISASAFVKKFASPYVVKKDETAKISVKTSPMTAQVKPLMTPYTQGTRFWVSPNILPGQKCWECRQIIITSDHYKRRKRCRSCPYSTCCYRALDKHQKDDLAHDYDTPLSKDVPFDDLFQSSSLIGRCHKCGKIFDYEIDLERHYKNQTTSCAFNGARITIKSGQGFDFSNMDTLSIHSDDDDLSPLSANTAAITALIKATTPGISSPNVSPAPSSSLKGITTGTGIHNQKSIKEDRKIIRDLFDILTQDVNELENLENYGSSPRTMMSQDNELEKGGISLTNAYSTPKTILKKPNPEQPLLTQHLQSSKKLRVEFDLEAKVHTIGYSPIKMVNESIEEESLDEFGASFDDMSDNHHISEPTIVPSNAELLMKDVLTNTTNTLPTENI